MPVGAWAGVQSRVPDGAFAPLDSALASRSHVTVHGVPLADGEDSDLEVEPFDVWAEGARIVVFTDHGIEYLRPPVTHLFRGHIVHEPRSLVFISSSELGIHGYVFRDTQRFAIHSRRVRDRRAGQPSAADSGEVFVDELSDDEAVSREGSWECDVDKMAGRDLVPATFFRERKPRNESIVSPTATYVLNVAVDSDHQFYLNMGSSTSTAGIYLTNLAGMASTIYHRDLQTDIKLANFYIASSPGLDPFTIVPGTAGTPYQTTLDALVQFGQVWHAANGVIGDPRNIGRSAALLMSGKSQRAGTAFVGTMCSGDFAFPTVNVPGGYGGAYAYLGGAGLDGTTVPDPAANPNLFATTSAMDMSYWTLLGFVHELGHNVQSPHTHCVALSPTDATTYGRPVVDQCFSGEPGPACYSNGTNAPVNASVPAEGGTIMSYCNQTPGHGTAIRYLFGKAGEASHVIVDAMKAALDATTPSLSALNGVPSSMMPACSTTVSVTTGSGLTYLWSITNGTITAGQGTNAVTFTANTNPVTVKITETNANGCSASDSASITVGSSAPPVPGGVVATAATATSVTVTWTASACASSYEVARTSSTSASTFTIIGNPTTTSFTDTTVSANAAYLYEVRSVGSTGLRSAYSGPDLATTVLFTDDPLVAGTTVIKRIHVNELRTAVEAVRTLAGLSAYSFIDPTLTTTTPVKAVHVTDLRSALDAARSALLLSALSYTDPTLTVHATVVKAIHLQELRGGVK